MGITPDEQDGEHQAGQGPEAIGGHIGPAGAAAVEHREHHSPGYWATWLLTCGTWVLAAGTWYSLLK